MTLSARSKFMLEKMEVEQDCGGLTEWEDEFITSLTARVATGKDLTPNQITKLEQIFDER